MTASKAGEWGDRATPRMNAAIDTHLDDAMQAKALYERGQEIERDLDEAVRSEAAIRILMTNYNLGGWTDAEAAIKRAIAAEARAAEAERERDEARKAGMSALLGNVDIRFCAHCGWTTEGRGTLEELQAHVESCEKHPLHAALKRASAAELDAGRLNEDFEVLAAGLMHLHMHMQESPEQEIAYLPLNEWTDDHAVDIIEARKILNRAAPRRSAP